MEEGTDLLSSTSLLIGAILSVDVNTSSPVAFSFMFAEDKDGWRGSNAVAAVTEGDGVVEMVELTVVSNEASAWRCSS